MWVRQPTDDRRANREVSLSNDIWYIQFVCDAKFMLACMYLICIVIFCFLWAQQTLLDGHWPNRSVHEKKSHEQSAENFNIIIRCIPELTPSFPLPARPLTFLICRSVTTTSWAAFVGILARLCCDFYDVHGGLYYCNFNMTRSVRRRPVDRLDGRLVGRSVIISS